MAKKRAAAAVAPAPATVDKPKEKPKGVVGFVRSIVPAVAAALVIRAFVFEPFSIPSGSMLPTLQIGDYVIVSKFAYGIRIPFTNQMAWQASVPQRGDVVVFDHPNRPGEDLIKRVIGLPGERVELRDGVLTVDGVTMPRELVEQSHAVDDYHEILKQWSTRHGQLFVETLTQKGEDEARHFVLQTSVTPDNQGTWIVPPGHLFVLGDNRDNSSDSRVGPWFVPLGNVRGKASVIGLSWGPGYSLRTDRFFRGLDAGVPER